jgi:hypothetical protein
MGRTSLARVEISKTTALYPNAVFVQWNIYPDEDGVHLVDVARSGAPDGPWEPVAQSLANAYQYLDSHFNLPPPPRSTDIREGLHFFSLTRDVYYRVTVTPPSGPTNEFTSSPTPIEPGLDRRTRLFKRKILRDEATAFRRLNGIPIIALKRRHWGTRCRDCYDPGLREGTMEHCRTCYGTTFEGGYWSSVLIRGRRSPAPVQTQISEKGKSELNLVTFITLDYPHLEPDDLLVDVQRNDRFLVQIVTPTLLKTVVVHQTLTASLVERGATEYEVPVDPNTAPPLY